MKSSCRVANYNINSPCFGSRYCIKNYSIAVKKRGDDITFLRRIIRGPADDSYGIEVAKLAGINDEVVRRAKEILGSIEGGEAAPVRRTASAPMVEESGQLSMLDAADNPIINKLKELDVNVLTPIEAMQILHELSKEASTY